ncbi:hypothetical protein [Terrisporobacter glycolicus]|uniref:Uncharacterized protein n=1 Tax=Terrisporobacter glycolicus ATCC 14880 = DSM 1288 TaxID=1121315 RepID=A0ABZ2EVQ1_9FIRM|nr:hypothetical protein [Terrisporobacter glycolicus]
METLEKVSKSVGKYMAIIVLIVAAVALFVLLLLVGYKLLGLTTY